MAYLNFSESFDTATATVTPGALCPEVAEPAAHFTAIEWLVIGLAERDGLSSLSTPTGIARALAGLFGLGASSKLADERLERLRRFAVLVRHHGWRVPSSEVKAFLAQFSVAQLEAVIASATRRKGRAMRRAAA